MNKTIFIKILIVIGILLAGLLSSILIGQKVYAQMTANLDQGLKQIESEYSQTVAQRTDANALVKAGLHQADANVPDLALISLKRATQLQPNYRDGWLALGLAQLKTNDVKAALVSFQTAEKLDPINPKTYELLKIAYERLEDMAGAKTAQDKFDFLTKK